MDVDQEVIIIGAGMSGIGMAVQLVRQFGIKNFELVEKTDDVGGTWFVNTYPGCGCDVPSHFYSYSFAKNPDWSQKFAMQPEIYQYFRSVAQKYNIIPHIRFRSIVEKAQWDPETATWLVTITNASKKTYTKRSKFIISAVGGLSIPKQCDIPGAEKFKGALFHSAEWDHSIKLAGKEVVTIGNGCSATQFVPIISSGPDKVKKVTQFSRQAHWLSERLNPKYSESFKAFMKYFPGAIFAYRAYLYWLQERDFAGFHVETGIETRNEWTRTSTDYIKRNAPEKYAEALVPRTVIACKRRVMDTDYLKCLHRDNVELVFDDPIKEITEDGVITHSNRFIHADVITLANGFETQKTLFPMEIRGESGQTVSDYWDQVSGGASQAYQGTCIAGFPNFFLLMGPNTLSGHLSVIYTTECQIEFVLRLMQPIVKPSLFSRLAFRQSPDAVVVRSAAEESYNNWLRSKAKKLVWATGCTSWFLDPKSGRNTVMFPDWQYMYWWKCVMVQWKDFSYMKANALKASQPGTPLVWVALALLAFPVAKACTVVFSSDLQTFGLKLLHMPTELKMRVFSA